MKTHHPHSSYSDLEIATYVLGLSIAPERMRDIQARLAHDDAAAARALKWEAYLLSIVDALPPAEPPEDLLTRIHASLGMEPPDEAEILRHSSQTGAAIAGSSRARRGHGARGDRRVHLNRKRLAMVAGGVVVIALVVLLVLANLHEAPRSTVQETVQTHHQ